MRAEKAFDEEDLVLCLLALHYKIEKGKKEGQFAQNVKMPMEAGMLCTIDGEMLHLFAKNVWIGDCITSCHRQVQACIP